MGWTFARLTLPILRGPATTSGVAARLHYWSPPGEGEQGGSAVYVRGAPADRSGCRGGLALPCVSELDVVLLVRMSTKQTSGSENTQTMHRHKLETYVVFAENIGLTA